MTAVAQPVTGPSASRVISCTGLAVWDTGKNNTQLSDGTYPWRKAAISSAGGLSVTGDTAHGVTDAGNAVKVGGYAKATSPAAVSDGQRVNAWYSTRGHANVGIGVAAATGDGLSTAVFVTDTSGAASQALATVGYGSNGTTWDRARTVQALDASPNTDVGVLAAGAGPGFDRKQNPAGVSATSTASAVTVETDGADVISFVFTTIGVTPGSMIIESSNDDGTTWVTAGAVLKLGAELWITGAFVPAVGDSYTVRCTGLRRVRVRVNAVYASGTVTVKWTASIGPAIIKAIDLAPQPHNIGQTITNYQSASTGVVTSSVLIAATAAKKVYVAHLRISCGGTTAGTLALYSGTGAFTEGTSQTLFYSEFAPSSTNKPGAIVQFPIPWSSGTVNEDIRLTTTGLTATHIAMQYYIT